MDNLNIGRIIDKPYLYQRDAIHVAVMPVTAGEDLQPGQHVRLDESDLAMGAIAGDALGIADPFIKLPIQKSQRFWLFLYPGTISSLRHDWTHPHFSKRDANEGEKWLRVFAETLDYVSYNDLIEGTKEYLSGNYSETRWGNTIAIPREFWGHYEAVTGIIVPESDRTEYFSCSC